MWRAASGPKGGVAILVNPYGAVRECEAWREDLWTEHLVMMRCRIFDTSFIMVNVYAPARPNERREFYRGMAAIPAPQGEAVLVGGDFNCVTDMVADRWGSSKGPDIGATQLEEWMAQWDIVDVMDRDKPEKLSLLALEEFGSKHHTYHYSKPDGTRGSSRIDCWYAND
jgi:hypothetical protein